MAIANRGLKNIRTLSRRVDARAQSHRTYMQITCLEMEKARRASERRSASLRVAEIDARIREIEAEKQMLFSSLDGPIPSSAARRGAVEVSPQVRRVGSGFRVRY
jgi:hypothetical protein